MKTFKLLFLIILAGVLLSCNNGTNRNNNKNNDQDGMIEPDTMSQGSMFFITLGNQKSDEDFIKEAISSSLMEVELGKMAGEKGTNPRIKNFGQLMVKDHSKSGEELRAIAISKNINAPSSLDEKHNRVVQDLQNEDAGKDFDMAYIREMVKAHEKDIDLYQKQAEDGTDPQLKTFASKNLPVLLMHRDSIQNIQKDLR